MTRWILPPFIAALCLMGGCKKQPSQIDAARTVAQSAAAPPSAQRYIAVKRRIDIETAEPELQKAWESIAAFCGTIRCEIVSSNLVNRTSYAAPSGSLSMRVVPDDMKKLLDQLGKTGTLVQQNNQSEDKTSAVIDVEAKIKNLTEYRDSLRALLAKQSGSLKDLIEVRRELTEVQSQLDSQATLRKVLADETEKVAIEIHFSVKGAESSKSGLGKIRTALSESTNVLGDSIAVLITLIIGLIPWLVVIAPIAWVVVRIRRRRKTAKSA